MNAPYPLPQQLAAPTTSSPAQETRDIDFNELVDIVFDGRWLIAAVAAASLTIGASYAFLARPVFESDLLIQVEDSAGSAKSFLGDAASLFDIKTTAAAELEIIRSRLVVGKAVDNARLYIDAQPSHFPVVGEWLAKHASGLSTPGLWGMGGWVWGREAINVDRFEVPQALEGANFKILAADVGAYVLQNPDVGEIKGRVGQLEKFDTKAGPIEVLVSALVGHPGAEFNVKRSSRTKIVQSLQEELDLAEKGRQSGVIQVALRGSDPDKLVLTLNEIGKEYVRQNVERKAAEAQKTLSILDTQLPQYKRQVDSAEEAYNRYRNERGTIALDEEAKMLLSQSVELQSKLFEAQQRRRELASRYTGEHPMLRTLDDQIRAWNGEIAALNQRIKGLPSLQQDAFRLERDAKLNRGLYEQLQNNVLQIQLIREGKVGNVRLIDPAVRPEESVRPKRPLVVLGSLAFGLLAGMALAFARTALLKGIRSPQELEAHTGLNVYCTIPLSPLQTPLSQKVHAKEEGVHVLATIAPDDAAVESLRSMRTALQFAMLDASNNRLIITGATPGVGKSFISVNFASILASAGFKVLLVDADLRKGYLNHYFGLDREWGLSEAVAGSLSLAAAVRKDVLPGLDLVTTGVFPPNPAELMMSGALRNVIEQLSKKYDYCIIDTPPVLVAGDTAGVAPYAGAVLLVARSEQTLIGDVHEAAKRLSQVGKNVAGILFNGVDLTRRHYGSYHYRYGSYRYKQYAYASK